MSKRFFLTLACAVAVSSAPALAWAAAEVTKPCPAEPTDMSITYGDHVSCEISPVGDMDLFRFQGQAGERMAVVGTRLAGGSPCIEVRGPAPGETQVTIACGNNFRLDAVLPASGLFTLRATEAANDGTVSYGLTLERVYPPSPTIRNTCWNCVLTDQIDPVGDLDFFSFAGRAGDEVVIQATRQAGGSPCVELFGPTGGPVGNFVCGNIARRDLVLEQDGPYTVLLSEGNLDGVLDYTLYLECFGTCPGSLGPSDLALSLSDSPDPVIGSTLLTYTLAVSNSGPQAASSLSVSQTLPAGVTFGSATGSGWTCGHSSGTVTCTRPSLDAGAAPDITVQVTPGPAATILSSSASVSAAESDPYPANNTDTETTTVVARYVAVGTRTKTVLADAGEFVSSADVTYSLTLANAGNVAQADNSGHELVDTLPSTLTLVSAAATSGTAVADVPTNTVTWDGGLASGGSVTITIHATIQPTVALGTTISNQATVSYDADANGSNEATTPTDDPDQPGANDPTSFVVVSSAMDFYPVTPCRVFDTRQASGPTAGAPLTCGTARSFTLIGGTCGVPASAKAVSVNLTGTASTAQGNLRLYAAGAVTPLVSTLNYVAGQTRANNAVAPLGTSGQISVLCSPSGTTHVVLDVNGYFE